MTNQIEVPPKVMTLTEVAQSAGVSLSTLRREITRGSGPEVVSLSPRRKGVRCDHYRRWLDERVSKWAARVRDNSNNINDKEYEMKSIFVQAGKEITSSNINKSLDERIADGEKEPDTISIESKRRWKS
jgi:predicted DNA-binding transcriptional regulator AlpA